MRIIATIFHGILTLVVNLADHSRLAPVAIVTCIVLKALKLFMIGANH